MKSWIVLLLSLIVIFTSPEICSTTKLSKNNYLCLLYLILGLSEGFSICILMQIISSYFKSDCEIVKKLCLIEINAH